MLLITATEDLPAFRQSIQADSSDTVYEAFIKHLTILGEKRRGIAQQLQTPKAERFGVFRLENSSTNLVYTPISPESPNLGPYQPWARHIKETVFKNAPQLFAKTEDTNTPWIEDPDDGLLRARLRIRLLKKDGMTNHYMAGELQKYCEKYPQFYDAFTKQDFATPDAVNFLLLEIELGLKENFVPCTTIAGVFKADSQKPNGFSQKSLASFLTSPLIAAHSYPKYFKSLLQIASQAWLAALLWDQKDLSQGIDRIARVQYVIDHISPFYRGSGAIAEFTAESLFNSYGYDVYLAPGTISMVQVGLGVSLQEYRTLYPQMVRVKPMATPLLRALAEKPSVKNLPAEEKPEEKI